jgi:hypothetical protein
MSLLDEIQKFLLVGFKYDCLVFPIDQHPFILESTVHSERNLTRQGKPRNGILRQNVACSCHDCRRTAISTTTQQNGRTPTHMDTAQSTHLNVVTVYNFANKYRLYFFLKKLTDRQPIKNLPSIYGTRKFVVA